MITQLSIPEVIQKQRAFFKEGKTKDINFRLQQLKILNQAIIDYEQAIFQSVSADLHKSETETFGTEIAVILKEIEYSTKNLRKWTRAKKVGVPFQLLPASARIQPEPLGLVLIIGPWNYPIQLIMAPLVAAIAAGNCAILKPSELAPHTSQVMSEIINKYFDPAYIALLEGGVETSQQLLAENFDHIFFTGGTAVGKIVMQAAAKNLTPVTLELGGKSPCIVDSDVNIELAARRITWGKFVNAGQTCVAPDYLLVNKGIKKNLLDAIQACIREFYGDNPAKSPDYGRIIHQKHFDRLVNLLKDGKILIGGQTDSSDRYIAPTVIENVSLTEPIMQEEIFGPILPVLEYTDIAEAIALINSRPKPLALYLFSNNKSLQKRVCLETSSGAMGINNTLMHTAVPSLPFGGVNDSGIGSYHGKAGFDTFSHHKSVLNKPLMLDFKLLYPPYEGKLPWIKRLFS
ncbi:aldehyde dehydrogenase [Aetokthonos hydrillicola Thurmond2011]|jgi:aldehyde dehydrogenase (NAD+)|uniref:Aldehyde dehydrogenase n=2 Tax=Aetokthonos TaxID=1550243 RepID=A0AAP5I8N5_9CYAN|nr:aldehyde dehydrogenase [Aetokthonos hydrillicola]MBW4586863.1 aldehyde dehydrogenase [Aetokthonos hydrillicola CCALA 1050]MDR9895779.1 aldehyde dehydrogenase [Aetokthonos hydrillicola Thurmond2011]